MKIPLFDRLDNWCEAKQMTESELMMLKLAVVELAQDEEDSETDSVGEDGRDLVLHARDACADADIDLNDEDGDDDGDEDAVSGDLV